ncbi:MAG: hypothetical protein ACTSV7_08210 [Candidatus Baldrarchaeia archaeon]
MLKVLVTGITGTYKEELFHDFCKYTEKRSEGQITARYYELEKELESEEVADCTLPDYLDIPDGKRQQDYWDKAWDRLINRVKDEKPQVCFIGMHCTFQRHSRLLSPLDWERIALFQPDIILNLIDDVFSCHQTIARREQKLPSGSYMRLREVMSWRTTEILLSDLLGKFVSRFRRQRRQRINCFVVSIKHPPEMLYALLFEPHKLPMYLSYPISSTRFEESKQEEIDNIRKKFHNQFVVFDPLTIDEKPLQFSALEHMFLNDIPLKEISKKLGMTTNDVQRYLDMVGIASIKSNRSKRVNEKGETLFQISDRWATSRIPCLFDSINDSRSEIAFPLQFNLNEIIEIAPDIDNHIEMRDYRLIDQAAKLGGIWVGYRPQYEGHASRGVTAEYTYARNIPVRRYAVFFPEDGPPARPFNQIRPICNSVNELINMLQSYGDSQRKRLYSRRNWIAKLSNT